MLTKQRRENLLPHVKEARRLAEDTFDRALSGLGLFKDRDPLPAERITDPAKHRTRAVIDEVVARDREVGGLAYVEARQRYVEHCAFTLVNRIAALRAMEVRGFLPKSVIAEEAQYAGLSPWARDLLEAGSLDILGERIAITTPDDARWQAIRDACAAVSRDVGVLFDLQDEYSVVSPESVAIKSIVAELTGSVTQEDWESDDILGWVYQYYNVSANEAYRTRRRQRGYTMTADDMIVANQFYTPHWVVRILVDNTLGRIWWESIPDLARRRCGDLASPADVCAEENRLRGICRERCAYLVPLPDEQRLGWWGEEARANAESAAEAEMRERHPETGGNSENCPRPRAPSIAPRAWKKVRDLKTIDPACGSGHFLLYVFDVLRQMYEVELPADVPPPETVPDLILRHNLHGIDVDLRACQLATFNLYLKARLAYREITGRDDFHPSGARIVCAGARVTNGENRARLLESFSSNLGVQELAAGILDDLSRTAEIGSLLKVRQKFEPLLHRQRVIRGQSAQGDLFDTPEYQRDMFVDSQIEELTLHQIVERLSRFEDEARPSGDVGRLLFAREMSKSCGLVGLLSEHYDVLLMNPPYGTMPPSCKDYCAGNSRKRITAHYPQTGNDIYAAFVQQAIDLTLQTGFVGMLTSQIFMFVRRFSKLRTDVLNIAAPPDLILDCEFGVLDGATVGTAASVLRRCHPTDARLDKNRRFIRLWHSGEGAKEAGYVDEVQKMIAGTLGSSSYAVPLADFEQMAWFPYAYWVSPSVRAIYQNFPPLDRDQVDKPTSPKLADVKQGLASGSDPRFVRFFWEVDPANIARNREDTSADRKWAPFAKGGWLDEFQADISCVVEWGNDGEIIRNYRTRGGRLLSRPQNRPFYFRGGLSWMTGPQMGSILKGQLKRINARILPENTIMTVNVCGVYPVGIGAWDTLALLNSELAYFLVRIYGPRKIEVGTVGSLPFPAGKDTSSLARYAQAAYELSLSERASAENSPYFVAPAILLALQSDYAHCMPSVDHPHAGQFSWPSRADRNPGETIAPDVLDRAWCEHGSLSNSLRDLAAIASRRLDATKVAIQELQVKIDEGVYDVFEIDEADRAAVAAEISLRQKRPVIDDSEEPEPDEEAEEPSETLTSEADMASADNLVTFTRVEVADLVSFAVKLAMEEDNEGIVPITQAGAVPPLGERVKSRFREWFGDDQLEAKWAEAGEILGGTVEQWLAVNFFDHHLNTYWCRPSFWQFTSAYCVQRGSLPGAFSCLVNYHKLRGNTLQNILSHYLAKAQETAQAQYDATRAVLEGVEKRGGSRKEIAASRRTFDEADRRLRELVEFTRRLRELDTGARPVSPPPGEDAPWLRQKIAEVTGGPAYGRGWLSVIDYGVRVNIEPLKAARVVHRAADRIT